MEKMNYKSEKLLFQSVKKELHRKPSEMTHAEAYFLDFISDMLREQLNTENGDPKLISDGIKALQYLDSDIRERKKIA